ncbi:hypothetical protein IWX90DRAFT_97942 [Phyllosticta citrichinensis]|uniref:Transmembrane protein n=1 Tax=Phyllosticta citrichinensis TaxID=1130410 RepID=A0ABR1Y1G3_9PEZI
MTRRMEVARRMAARPTGRAIVTQGPSVDWQLSPIPWLWWKSDFSTMRRCDESRHQRGKQASKCEGWEQRAHRSSNLFFSSLRLSSFLFFGLFPFALLVAGGAMLTAAAAGFERPTLHHIECSRPVGECELRYRLCHCGVGCRLFCFVSHRRGTAASF